MYREMCAVSCCGLAVIEVGSATFGAVEAVQPRSSAVSRHLRVIGQR